MIWFTNPVTVHQNNVSSYPQPSIEATSVFTICQDYTEDGMHEGCRSKYY